jgi:predicted ester cyclase
MTDPSGSRDPIEVARSYLASFADRDPDAIAAHVSDGFVNEHTAALGSSCEGRDEYLRRLPGFLDSMPGLRYEIERIVADGDQAVAFYTLHAHVDGRGIVVRGAMRMTVSEGLITHRTDYWDAKVFLDQIGP